MTEEPQTPPPSSVAYQQPGPISVGERIEVVDVLRGFAVFGILAVNMFWFSNPFQLIFTQMDPWTGMPDQVAQWLIQFFCEGKFYSLFSFLFGFGMAVQMTRAEARGDSFVRLYVRRLCVLLAIGAGHVVFLWAGDILIYYALGGFLLLLFRKRKPTTLLAWAIPCLLVTVLLITGLTALGKLAEAVAPAAGATATMPTTAIATAATTPPDIIEMFETWTAKVCETYSHGSFGQILIQRLGDYAFASFFMLIFMGPAILGMFLFGLYAGKKRLLHEPAAHLVFIRRLALWSLVLGVVGNLTAVLLRETISSLETSWLAVPLTLGAAVGQPALCFFYAAGIVLLAQKAAWRRYMKPLAAVGRMALSNYLLQSLICTMIFNAYGLGFFGKVGPALGLALTCMIFAIQIPLSVWWLRHFRFGPAEWAWRTLTYGQRQPLRSIYQ
ncbi:MAG: DUF418 domain-containing protein [Phycisphaerae bacterium]|nr:DUF418 domain-containing protein [Phycisphaerae bacterium]